MTSKEQRRHLRIDSLNLVHISFKDPEDTATQGMGRTLNVSESGILLETTFEIPGDCMVHLTIGFEDELIELNGKAVYCKQTASNMHETGIEFIDVDSAILPSLRAFVEVHQQQ